MVENKVESTVNEDVFNVETVMVEPSMDEKMVLFVFKEDALIVYPVIDE